MSSSNVNTSSSRRGSHSGGPRAVQTADSNDCMDYTPPPSSRGHDRDSSAGGLRERNRRRSSGKVKELPIADGGNPGKLSPAVTPRVQPPTWASAASAVSPRASAGAGLGPGIAEESSPSADGRDRNGSMSIGNIEAIDSPRRFNGRAKSVQGMGGQTKYASSAMPPAAAPSHPNAPQDCCVCS